MSTKKLARELGLIRKRSQSSNGQKKQAHTKQLFSYLIVIDFESTCWREKTNYGQEIIEFPAVLLNTSSGEIESEFHTYVQPQEHPILSEFCTELTGITQRQVESGVPLQICLSRFSRWLQVLQQERGTLLFGRDGRAPNPTAPCPCTFVTWSDWDLGVCLLYECKRKQICKPEALNSWIDLRATYRLFYNRKPKGLNGALQDLGIEFSGREHSETSFYPRAPEHTTLCLGPDFPRREYSSLDDARNTTRLAWRMMMDGCVMKVTKTLDRAPLKTRPLFGNAPGNGCPSNKSGHHETQDGVPKSTSKMNEPLHEGKKQSPVTDIKTILSSDTKVNGTKYQSLVLPKTVLCGLTTPLCGNRMTITGGGIRQNASSALSVPVPVAYPQGSSLVLVSTTANCITDLTFDPETAGGDWPEGAVLTEMEEASSYDDVLLEDNDGYDDTSVSAFAGSNRTRADESSVCPSYMGSARVPHKSKTEVPSMSSAASSLLGTSGKATVSRPRADSSFVCPNLTVSGPVPYSSTTRPTFSSSMTSSVPSVKAPADTSSASTAACFKKPKAATADTSSASTAACFKKPKAVASDPYRSAIPSALYKTTTPRSVIPSEHYKTTTPIPDSYKTTTPRSSFTIYRDDAPPSTSAKSSRSSLGGLFAVPSSVLSSSVNRSALPLFKGAGKITSPLCGCGRRAKRQSVGNGGPNHGRAFYCCPVRRRDSGSAQAKGCQFFKWESALFRSTLVSPAASRTAPRFTPVII